ncbi:glycosyltransferase family 1 protein [Rhodococcus sp. HNM0569]|nr:glycosyltransferase family 1 protein [Rhodococcus sp. HNM0569]
MRISMVAEQANPLAREGLGPLWSRSTHVAELSAALARAGHDVTVFTRRDRDDAPERQTTADGYDVVNVPVGPPEPIPPGEALPLMGEFGGFLENMWELDRPDLVHAHYWMSGIATQLATKLLGIPSVQTFHTLGAMERRFARPDRAANDRIRLEQLIARGATRVLATCTDEVFELSHQGLPRTRTSIVPAGVDVTRFAPDGPRELDGALASKDAQHRLVAAGTIVPSRGFETAIEAMKWLPDAELVIAGAAPDDKNLARLKSAAKRYRVTGRVRFVERVPHTDMPALLRSADAVVCTPWFEPTATLALEAHACGTPVVAAAVGALRETVADGVTGRLVPPRNARKLADAVRTLLGDEETLADYSVAARKRATTRYSWDRIAEDAVKAYSRCVSAPPKQQLRHAMAE